MANNSSWRESVSRFLLFLLTGLAVVFLLGAVVGIGTLIIVWGLSASQHPESVGLPAVLLTAASLFILIFSVLVGGAAIFGWRGLRDLTAHRVQSGIEERFEQINLDHKLQLNTTRAYIYQDVSYVKNQPEEIPTIRVTNGKLLDQAISTLDATLRSAPDDHSKLGLIKNNLVFLLAVRADKKDGERACRLAGELKDHYLEWNDPAVLNTYARVVAVYHSEFPNPRKELSRVHENLRWILRRGNEAVTKGERKNAQRHLAEVRRALQQYESEATS